MTCEGCGAERPALPAIPSTSMLPALRPVLAAYPAQTPCPFACPICRAPLAWDGGCDACHGCTSGRREDWTFPGDRYELDDGYWRKVSGPRQACTPAENAAGFAAVRAILAKGDEQKRSGRAGLVPVDPAIRADPSAGLRRATVGA
jgi:hypothetical protein